MKALKQHKQMDKNINKRNTNRAPGIHKLVAAHVEKIGRCTHTDIVAHFPDHSETQVKRALEAAAYQKLIKSRRNGIYCSLSYIDDVTEANSKAHRVKYVMSGHHRTMGSSIISRAMRNRHEIERVWFNIAQPIASLEAAAAN